jgi:hypothetical protein
MEGNQMIRTATVYILGLAMFAPAAFAQSADQSARIIPSRLDCSALSSSPEKNGPFTAPLMISFAKGTLTADRPLISGAGKEKFEGRIDPLGRIEMTGRYDDRQAWAYKLKGQLSDTKLTVLKGDLEVTAGAIGHRSCTITFLLKPPETMAAFSF